MTPTAIPGAATNEEGPVVAANPGVSDEPLIDIRQLAGWLKVSEHSVRKWCSLGPSTGLVPRMIRVNGQLRFRPCDVRAFIESKEIR